MKNKVLSTISTIMMFFPWTILPLRSNSWALESPVAEIMIISYAIFMVISGIFTVISYVKGKVQSNLMQVCIVVNGFYSLIGIVVIAMIILPRIV